MEGPWDPVVAVYEKGSEEESVVEKGRALGTAETLKSIARQRTFGGLIWKQLVTQR